MAVAAILLGIAFFILIASSIADATKDERAVKRNIEESRGRVPSAKYKPDELQSIASNFVNRRTEQPSAFIIDNITWHDLDMDEVFARINATGSTPGK